MFLICIWLHLYTYRICTCILHHIIYICHLHLSASVCLSINLIFAWSRWEFHSDQPSSARPVALRGNTLLQIPTWPVWRSSVDEFGWIHHPLRHLMTHSELACSLRFLLGHHGWFINLVSTVCWTNLPGKHTVLEIACEQHQWLVAWPSAPPQWVVGGSVGFAFVDGTSVVRRDLIFQLPSN